MHKLITLIITLIITFFTITTALATNHMECKIRPDANAHLKDLTGWYEVKGNKPNSKYYGRLRIRKTGNTYKIYWKIPSEGSYWGTGLLVGNILAANWKYGVALYFVSRNQKNLCGFWTNTSTDNVYREDAVRVDS